MCPTFNAAVKYAAAREVVKRYRPYLDELDLTYTQYITMMVMWGQKEIFEKFHDCWGEYVSLSEAAIFEYAFRLGARLTMEVKKDT